MSTPPTRSGLPVPLRPTTKPQPLTVDFSATILCAAFEMLGQAMRECPEEPIESFFGVAPDSLTGRGIANTLDREGVEWRRS